VRDGLQSVANTATTVAVTVGSPALGALNQLTGNPLGQDAAAVTGAAFDGLVQHGQEAVGNLITATTGVPAPYHGLPAPGTAAFPTPVLQTPGAVLDGLTDAARELRDAAAAVANLTHFHPVGVAALNDYPHLQEVLEDLSSFSTLAAINFAATLVQNEATAAHLSLTTAVPYHSPLVQTLQESLTLGKAGEMIDSSRGVQAAVVDWIVHTVSFGFLGGEPAGYYHNSPLTAPVTSNTAAFDRGYNNIGDAYRVASNVPLIVSGVAALPKFFQSVKHLSGLAIFRPGGGVVTAGGPALATEAVLTDEAMVAIRALLDAAAKAGWPLGAGVNNLPGDTAVFTTNTTGGGGSSAGSSAPGPRTAVETYAESVRNLPDGERPFVVATVESATGTYYGRSGFTTPVHPVIAELLESIPMNQRNPLHHARCAEVEALSQALYAAEARLGRPVTTAGEASELLSGSVVQTAQVRSPNTTSLDQGQEVMACNSCQWLLDLLSLSYGR